MFCIVYIPLALWRSLLFFTDRRAGHFAKIEHISHRTNQGIWMCLFVQVVFWFKKRKERLFG
jgi:hypothetical protein